MNRTLLIIFCCCLFSCQNTQIDHSYPGNPENLRKQRAGKLFDDITLFGDKKDNNNTKNNPSKLWLSSLEVIGNLSQVHIANEESGLILTRWYHQDKEQNTRIKIHLKIKKHKPIRENLNLKILTQMRDDNGKWKIQKSPENSPYVLMIKNKILEKSLIIP